MRSSGVQVISVLPEEGRSKTAREYLSRLHGLSRAEALEALPRALAEAEQTGADELKLWAALLALHGGAAEAECSRALSLLADVRPPSGTGTAAWRGLGDLARSALEARIRSLRSLGKAQALEAAARARVTESQRQTDDLQGELAKERSDSEALRGRLEEEKKTNQALRAQLAEEQKKTKALEGQIEQLKTIEKIMDRREEPKIQGSGSQ